MIQQRMLFSPYRCQTKAEVKNVSKRRKPRRRRNRIWISDASRMAHTFTLLNSNWLLGFTILTQQKKSGMLCDCFCFDFPFPNEVIVPEIQELRLRMVQAIIFHVLFGFSVGMARLLFCCYFQFFPASNFFAAEFKFDPNVIELFSMFFLFLWEGMIVMISRKPQICKWVK